MKKSNGLFHTVALSMLICPFFLLQLNAAPITVTGTVVNSNDVPIKGASLSLIRGDFTVRSNLSGGFSLTTDAAVSAFQENIEEKVFIYNNRLYFKNGAIGKIDIKVYDVHGVNLFHYTDGSPGLNDNMIDLKNLLSKASHDGLYWLEVRTNASSAIYPYVKLNGGVKMGAATGKKQLPAKKTGVPIYDTLLITKMGFKDKKLIIDRDDCDFGKIELELDSIPSNHYYYQTIGDVFVDRENYNVGLGSEVKFSDKYPGGYLLFKFNVTKLPSKKYKATLRLFAFMAKPIKYKFEYQLFKTTYDWDEGYGHWYWYNSVKSNNYDKAYALYPDYLPPENTQNPGYAEGIHYSNAAEFFESLVSIRKDSITVDYVDGINGSYPLFQDCAKIEIDVTDAIQKGEFSIVLKSLDPFPATSVHVYSKDHVDGWPVPELRIKPKYIP